MEDFEPPKIPRPKFKRKRRERTITSDEKDAILAHLYTEGGTEAEYQNRVRIGRMFHIAYLLGMAYSEVANLKKENYNGQLSFIRKKTGNPVTFEWLPDEAHDVLTAAIAASDSEYVFTHSGSTPKHFYSIMKKAVESAGLPYGRDNGVTFHSARHSFVTAAMQHADLKTVGSMSGHSDATMVLLYTHASPESRKRALQSMYGKKDLKDIYDKIRKGEMAFAEFEKIIY
jgi:integrase